MTARALSHELVNLRYAVYRLTLYNLCAEHERLALYNHTQRVLLGIRKRRHEVQDADGIHAAKGWRECLLCRSKVSHRLAHDSAPG